MTSTTAPPDADDTTPPDADDTTREEGDPTPEDGDATREPTADHADEPTGERPTEQPMFRWIRALDLPRRDGWIAGVCAGVADRLGVDVLLVRGVAVVVAVLGGPVTLLYAIGWFLLPDRHGTIHAQELGRGRVSPALAGIAGFVLLSLLPLTQGFWFLGAWYWGSPDFAAPIGRVLWTAVLLGLGIAVAVWIGRRAAAADPTLVPATTDDRPETVPSPPADAAADATDAMETTDATVLRPPDHDPPAPPPDAPDEELAAWRAAQAEWQRERARWTAEERRSQRERWREDAARGLEEARAAAAERRRIDRLTRPRASAAVVGLLVGAAVLVAGVLLLVAASEPGLRPLGAPIAVAGATIVFGVGAIVVALARRRSGALAALAAFSLVAALVLAALPTDREVRFESTIVPVRDGRYAMLTTWTWIHLDAERLDDARPADAGLDRDVVVDVWQLGGDIALDIRPDTTVRIEAVLGDGTVHATWYEADGPPRHDSHGATGTTADGGSRYDLAVGEGEPDYVVRLQLAAGDLHLDLYDPDDATPVPLTPLPARAVPTMEGSR